MNYEMLLTNYRQQAINAIETAQEIASEYLKVQNKENLQIVKLSFANAVQAIQLYQDKKEKFTKEIGKEVANG